MNKNDIAYAAGLFDAEGSIWIGRQKRKFLISFHHSLRISLASMNWLVLNWFKDNFDGYIRVSDKQQKNICFQWQTSRNIAASFLRATIPFLQIKKRQAELALQFQSEIKRNTGYNRTTEESLQRREQFRNQISILNRRRFNSESRITNKNKSEIAYVAGLFDGDGSIFIRKSPYFSLCVALVSINQPITAYLKEHFDGSISIDKRFTAFIWRTYDLVAENFLQRILPHLRIKKLQAELALQFRNEKKRNTGRQKITPKSFEQREWFRNQISAFNHFLY